jgi:hypothetical protein
MLSREAESVPSRRWTAEARWGAAQGPDAERRRESRKTRKGLISGLPDQRQSCGFAFQGLTVAAETGEEAAWQEL